MKIEVPELSLVLLVGASGSGKTTFAAKHFAPFEVVSSDTYRGVVANDPTDQRATRDAFELVHQVVRMRLRRGLLTVVDATNLDREARAPLLALAREFHVLPVAIALDVPAQRCSQRNAARTDRRVPPDLARRQVSAFRSARRDIKREGYRPALVLGESDIDDVVITRRPLWCDQRAETGPFDLIGDVHGCRAELEALLETLGYVRSDGAHRHPDGRRAIFLGDLVDRGPDSPGVLRVAMAMVRAGSALAVPGNHDARLVRHLRGKQVKLTHGLAETVEQLATEPESFLREVESFLDGLVSHLVLDGGALVVAHAGMREALQGRASGAVRQFALYGETTGEIDSYGLPVRHEWAREYAGRAMVVHGHTPVPRAQWVNGTLCVDTGCVFGGTLTALRYPERELVSVPAARVYCEPVRPLESATGPAAERVVALHSLTGDRRVAHRYGRPVTVKADYAAAALEGMSRFAVDPSFLIYLPPTMSPAAACASGPLLEHPTECFAYFREHGLREVVVEEKHMGSRAVAVVCRTPEVAQTRFLAAAPGWGALYTRTGRAFFHDDAMTQDALARLADAVGRAGLWESLATDWVCLDLEVLPWSAKASALLRTQYAPVAAAGIASLDALCEVTAQAFARGVATAEERGRAVARAEHLRAYQEAYRAYCAPVAGLEDYRFAPFHVLASEGAVHVDRDHLWHMARADELARAAPELVRATEHQLVTLGDEGAERAAGERFLARTAEGAEGVVVKPRDFVVRAGQGLVQPALKCRGPEYLRIIYGPEYRRPELLEVLRRRSLGKKRRLAEAEFSLGLEALHLFVEGAGLARFHPLVFAVLALTSDPVDPRL